MTKDLSKIVIAVDGPAGAGKSTVSKKVAEKLSLVYIDTGAMYRAITWLVLQNNLSIETQIDEIIKLTKEADLKLISDPDMQRVILNGQDISTEIRTPEIAKHVSAISAIPEVRECLVELQQKMGKAGGVILDGRDIGTTVFPNANLKIFLVASSRERAIRRQKQLESLGMEQPLDEVQADIERRDQLDYNREISPLKQADDAILIDTDHLSIKQVVDKIIESVNSALTLK